VDVVSTVADAPVVRASRGHLAWLVAAVVLAVAAIAYLAQVRWLMGAGTLGLSAIALAWYLVPGRRLAFALAAVALSSAGTVTFVAGLDLYMHHRYARTGGYNVWGYRGDAIGARSADERRVEMLGGSVAFGYGVDVDETIPAQLQRFLNHDTGSARRVVVNLGWNSEGAYSFQYTLKDYAYLHSDVAILYSGYNDLLNFNNQVFRHQSAVFRTTGYLPILPVIPLTAWLRLGSLGSQDSTKVVFTPKLTDKYATEAADTALRISQALERQLGKLAPEDIGVVPAGKPADWQYYVQAVRAAVTVALGQGKQVVVVTEPYISDRHVDQQNAVAAMLRDEFGGERRVHYLNAGRTVDLHDRALCYDGMHLTAAGNRAVAEWLAPRIAEVLR
jgi:lysophospholipase L1-like esterase